MNRLTLTDKNTKPCVMALGFFDGVHLGHRAVIEKAVRTANEMRYLSAVFTFDKKNFSDKKRTRVPELYSLTKRLSLIKLLGADFVLVPGFSEFCDLSPEKFVTLLADRFSAKVLCCGENFRFGKNASGDVSLLRTLAEKHGVDVIIVDAVTVSGIKVSSSAIRKAVADGDMHAAAEFLGRNYSICAKVEAGRQIGSRDLYPTINQKFSPFRAIPKTGVYSSRVIFGGESMISVTDIGVCPTVKESVCETVAETYIIDKNIKLYGCSVEVQLLEFIREEKKFSSVSELKEQISLDIQRVKEG